MHIMISMVMDMYSYILHMDNGQQCNEYSIILIQDTYICTRFTTFPFIFSCFHFGAIHTSGGFFNAFGALDARGMFNTGVRPTRYKHVRGWLDVFRGPNHVAEIF